MSVYESVPCPAKEAMRSCLHEHPGYEEKVTHGDEVRRACPCHTCCCLKPIELNFCYEQPKIPESFAPKRCWMKPTVPMEKRTTYKGSYVAPEECLKPAALYPPLPSVLKGEGPISDKSTYRLTYLPVPICQVPPTKPCIKRNIAEEPMDCATNYRLNYIPKPIILTETGKVPDNLVSSGKPCETNTTSRLSYLDPGRAVIPPSWAPRKCWAKPVEKMSGDTTNRASFLPICLSQPQTPPWTPRSRWQKPTKKMETQTTCRLAYLPPGRDCSTIKDPCLYGTCIHCDCKNPTQCLKTDACACDESNTGKADSNT